MNLLVAINIAYEAHAHQSYNDDPYVVHPFAVMLEMKTEKDRIVAMLHDVVEDTNLTLTDLMQYGFDATIITAIDAITRQANETYPAYIKRLSSNPIATRVKIADLQYNLSRMSERPDKEHLRSRYEQALSFLQKEYL